MATAIEALLEACERRSEEVGVLTLRDLTNKNQALIYLNNGGVYAIDVDSYDPPVKTRLMRTGRIDLESDLDSAISSVGGESSLQLPALIVQRQIADEYDVALVMKDFFLEAASEVLSWESVKTSWRKGFIYNEYPIPPIEGGRLIEIVTSRGLKFQQVADIFQVPADRVFEDASVLASPDFSGNLTKPEESSIHLVTKDNYQKIGDIMVGLGLTRVSVMKYIHNLWSNNAVDIFVNGRNIRGVEQEQEEEVLDFMMPSAQSPESLDDDVDDLSPITPAQQAEVPVSPIPVSPAIEVYDEPIDSMSSSSAIPTNPDLTFNDTPSLPVEEDSPQEDKLEQAYADSTNEQEEDSGSEFDEPAHAVSRYSSTSEEDIIDLDFDSPQETGQYAAPENETQVQENEPQAQALNDDSLDSGLDFPTTPLTTTPSALVQDEANDIIEEAANFTQEADRQVEIVQESVTTAQENPTNAGENQLLTEMQSMLSKINSAVGESTNNLSALAQQIEENARNLNKARGKKEETQQKIASLTAELKEVVAEEEKLEEEATTLNEQYVSEKEKVDEFTRGLDSLRSMFDN